jgi:Mrp family chromosome partitioning ATPase
MVSPARPRPAAPPGFPVFAWLRLHWLGIAFFGTLLGSGLAAAAWLLMPTKAESYAMLQVASAPSYVAYQNDPMRARTDFATYLKTTAQLIKSDLVLNRALNDDTFGVSKLAIIREVREPLVFLDEQVTVTYQDGNEVIRIGMKAENPEDARKVVNAIQTAYMKEVVEREVLRKKELLEKVRVAKVDLTDTIKRKGGTVDSPAGSNPPMPLPGSIVSGAATGTLPPPAVPGAIQQAGGVVPPMPVIGDSLRRSMADQLMKKVAEYDEQLVYLPNLIKDRERKRDQIKKQMEKSATEPAKEDAKALAERDPDVAQLRFEAKKARAEYAHYRGLAANPDAPSVVAYRDRAVAIEKMADEKRDAKAKELESTRRVGTSAALDQQFADAERELSRVQEQVQVATVLRDRARDELAKLPPELTRDEPKGPAVDPAKTDLVAHNVLLDRVTQQEIGLDFELTSPPRVSVLQTAGTAIIRDTKKQIIAAVGAGGLGFLIAALLAIAFEAKSRKISSLAELTAGVTMPTVAVVPHAPTVSTYRSPLKRADVYEAIDKLRTYVTQSWMAKGVKSVAVTSPLSDEGKVGVAVGLAESLARAGVRTLLVDFDLRSPAIHRLLQCDNGPGVCELLRGERQPGDTVFGLPSGLFVLTAGRWTDDTRHSAAGDRLKSLVDVLTQPFDCVVIHSHSLLTAAESVEVVRRADAVLLCGQCRETRMPLMTRAADRLTTMGMVNSGVVYVGATTQEALC